MTLLILYQPNFFFDVLFGFLTDQDASRFVSSHQKELYLKQWPRYHVKKIIPYQSKFRPIVHSISLNPKDFPINWCVSIHSIELTNHAPDVSFLFPNHVKNVKLSFYGHSNNINIKMGNGWEKLIVIVPETRGRLTLRGQSTKLQTLKVLFTNECVHASLWILVVQSPLPPTLHNLIIPAVNPDCFFLDKQQHLQLLLQISTLYVDSFLPCMEPFIMQSKTLTSLRAEFAYDEYILEQIPPTVTFFIQNTNTEIAEKYIMSADFETQLLGIRFLIQLNKSINNNVWSIDLANGLNPVTIDQIKKFLTRKDISLSIKLDLLMIFCVYDNDCVTKITFNPEHSCLDEIIQIFTMEILPQILILEKFERTIQHDVLLQAYSKYLLLHECSKYFLLYAYCKYYQFSEDIIDGVDFGRTCCERINNCHCLHRKEII